MAKAQTIDRIALTRQKMEAARERIKTNAQTVLPEKYTKENSPFLKMRGELHECPECGGELERWEGCYRCKKCGTSLC